MRGLGLSMILLAALAAACAGAPSPSLPPGTSPPGASPTPVPSVGPTQSPAPTVSALPGVPTIALPVGIVRTLTFENAEATWGARVYGFASSEHSGGPARLGVADLSGGTVAWVDVALGTDEQTEPPLGFGERYVPAATDGRWLAIVVWRRLGLPGRPAVPCTGAESEPLAWRILVAPLDPTDGLPALPFREFARGESRHVFSLFGQGEGCYGPRTPRVAADDGRIAYDVEDTTADRPFGSRIVLRSLAGGATEREVQTPTQVVYLALSGTTLAWTEAASDPGTGAPVPWAARVSTADHPSLADVALGAPASSFRQPPLLALDGDQLALERVPAADVGWDVWIQRLGSAGPIRVSPEGSSCELGAVAAGWVAMDCYADPGRVSVVVVWSAITGPRVIGGVPPPRPPPRISNGWLVDVGGPPIGPWDTLYGFPLDALDAS